MKESPVTYKKEFSYLLLTALYILSSAFSSHGQQVEVIKSDKLYDLLESCPDKGKIQLFNFWATWCAPCIRELPLLESVNNSYGNVDVTLISIDDVDLLESRVMPFIKRKGIKSKVMLLDETDFNAIINRIDKNWSGAIPASLIIDCRNDTRKFYEKEFEEDELLKIISDLNKNP